MSVNETSADAGFDGLPESLAELHETLPTQVGFLSSRIEHFSPKSALEGGGSYYTFQIQGGANEFIDCPATRVWFKYSLVKPDGSRAAAGHDDGKNFPVNSLATALFKNVSIKLNNFPISSEDSFYAYKADMETRFFTPVNQQETILQEAGYYKDDGPGYESLGNDGKALVWSGEDGHNPSTRARYTDCNGGGTVEVCSKIYSPIFDQGKPLPPGCLLEITFQRNTDDFCLIGPAAQKIQLQSMSVSVKFNKADPDIVNDIVRISQKDPLKFQLRTTRIIPFPKPEGFTDLSITNLFPTHYKLPRKIFFVIVRQEAEQGNRQYDPFTYNFTNVGKTNLVIGGVPRPSPELESPLQMLTCFQNACDSILGGDTNGIHRGNYMARNFCVGWDLSPTQDAPLESFTLDSTENCFLSIRLNRGLTHPSTVLVFVETEAELLLDGLGTPLSTNFC